MEWNRDQSSSPAGSSVQSSVKAEVSQCSFECQTCSPYLVPSVHMPNSWRGGGGREGEGMGRGGEGRGGEGRGGEGRGGEGRGGERGKEGEGRGGK